MNYMLLCSAAADHRLCPVMTDQPGLTLLKRIRGLRLKHTVCVTLLRKLKSRLKIDITLGDLTYIDDGGCSALVHRNIQNPHTGNFFKGGQICLVTIILGLAIMGFAQYIYMKAELGGGPRDTVAVGLKRRLEKVPIGVIVIGMLSVATCMGWILGGPIGIGTIICAALTGPLMQLAFRIVGFVPTAIEHQSIIDSFRILLKNK